MQTKHLPLLMLVLVSTWTLRAQTLHQQLYKLNRHWNSPIAPALVANEPSRSLGEAELIQTHLRLVIKQLTSQTPQNLSSQQLEARKNCLDQLAQYTEKGIFPKNLYHSERTPYFIDDFGTACAVGQMIIMSGHGDLAHAISKTHNYEYLENIPYPEVNTWAVNHGFSFAELQWVQPTYGCFNNPCQPGTIQHQTCDWYPNGCIGTPISTLSNFPLSYTWYSYNSSSGTWYNRPYNDNCGLDAGDHKCVIRDALGNTEEKFYTIQYQNTLQHTPIIVHPTSGCNGQMTIRITGGIPPFTIQSTGGVVISDTLITNLCAGATGYYIYDGNRCIHNGYAILNSPTSSIEFLNDLDFQVYPNPTTGLLTLNLDKSISEEIEVSVFTLTGNLIKTIKTSEQQLEIDLTGIENGLYLFSVKSKEKSGWSKVLKMNN